MVWSQLIRTLRLRLWLFSRNVCPIGFVSSVFEVVLLVVFENSVFGAAYAMLYLMIAVMCLLTEIDPDQGAPPRVLVRCVGVDMCGCFSCCLVSLVSPCVLDQFNRFYKKLQSFIRKMKRNIFRRDSRDIVLAPGCGCTL